MSRSPLLWLGPLVAIKHVPPILSSKCLITTGSYGDKMTGRCYCLKLKTCWNDNTYVLLRDRVWTLIGHLLLLVWCLTFQVKGEFRHQQGCQLFNVVKMSVSSVVSSKETSHTYWIIFIWSVSDWWEATHLHFTFIAKNTISCYYFVKICGIFLSGHFSRLKHDSYHLIPSLLIPRLVYPLIMK